MAFPFACAKERLFFGHLLRQITHGEYFTENKNGRPEKQNAKWKEQCGVQPRMAAEAPCQKGRKQTGKIKFLDQKKQKEGWKKKN